MDETTEATSNVFDFEFRRRMLDIFNETFEEQITLIRDPENGVEELHKLDGSTLTEEQLALLAGFERGWNEAFSTIAEVAGWGDDDGD